MYRTHIYGIIAPHFTEKGIVTVSLFVCKVSSQDRCCRIERHGPVFRGLNRKVALKGVIRFHDRKAYCAFFVPFSLENTFLGEKRLKEREVNIITNGGFEVKQMSSSEREAFMLALLERVWELRRKRKEVDSHAT